MYEAPLCLDISLSLSRRLSTYADVHLWSADVRPGIPLLSIPTLVHTGLGRKEWQCANDWPPLL